MVPKVVEPIVKGYENLYYQTRPFMFRFSDSGFINEDIIIEYFERVILSYQEKRLIILFDQAPSHYSEKIKARDIFSQKGSLSKNFFC